MENLTFIKDESGRIIKVTSSKAYAKINWAGNNLDIDFCNFVITIVLTARGVGEIFG